MSRQGVGGVWTSRRAVGVGCANATGSFSEVIAIRDPGPRTADLGKRMCPLQLCLELGSAVMTIDWGFVRRVLLQLLKEFVVPFFASVFWWLYSVNWVPLAGPSAKEQFAIAVTAFVAVSYIGAAVFRVIKQQRTEVSLDQIERRVGDTLARIDERTADVVAHLIGGESFCYLSVGRPAKPVEHITVVHQGVHPLYEITARVVDLEDMQRSGHPTTLAEMLARDRILNVGNLTRDRVMLLSEQLSLGSIGDARRFNIFFHARNGDFVQLMRFRRVESGWLCATRVFRGEAVVFENIDPGFPLSANEIDW